MKSRLCLHIGPHKTGTTYIQNELFDNAKTLRDAGVNYVQTGINIQFGQHALVEELQKRKTLDLWRSALKEMRKFPVNIISSENFDRLSEEEVRELARKLEAFEVQVVYVVRRSDDLLISNWQESVKFGLHKTWSEDLLPQINRPFSSKVINHSKVLDIYEKNFPGAIKILDFDALDGAGIDLVTALFGVIGQAVPFKIRSHRVNASLPMSLVELLRVLNARWRLDNLGNPGLRLRNELLATKHEAKTGLIEDLMTKVDVGVEEWEFSQSYPFAVSFEKFQVAYGARIVGPRSTVVPPKSYKLPSPNWVLPGGVMNDINGLYDVLLQRLRST
jgi:hypothetical protein